MKKYYLYKNITYIKSFLKIPCYCCASILALSISGVSPALSSDITVNITGEITNTTCSVSSDSVNKNVDLGSYPINKLSQAGMSSTITSFYINLENCGSVSRGVEVEFTGTPDTDIPSFFQSTATGIAIKLMDDTKKLISVGDTTKSYYISSGSTTKSLLFYAQMVATGPKIHAGSVSSTSVTFKTIYP